MRSSWNRTRAAALATTAVALAVTSVTTTFAAPFDPGVRHRAGAIRLGDGITSGAASAGGSTYVVGNAADEPEQDDAVVRKIDRAGKVQWADSFGGAGTTWDFASGVATLAGGPVVAGITEAPSVSTGGDGFLRRYDAAGTVLWSRQFGSGGGDPMDSVRGVTVADGSIYTVGTTAGDLYGPHRGGSNDVFVQRWSAGGNLEWGVQFGTPALDEGASIAVIDDTVYVGGRSYGVLPGGGGTAGSTGAYLTALRAHDGARRWTRQFGGRGDMTHALEASGSTLYLAGGQSIGPYEPRDAWVAAYSRNGTRRWLRKFGFKSINVAFGLTVAYPGVMVVGYTQQSHSSASDGFVQAVTSNGRLGWSDQVGPNVYFTDAASDGRGLWMVGTYTFNSRVAIARRYVRHRPDVQARRMAGTFVGNNVYSPTSQSVGQPVRRKRSQVFVVRAQNDGEVAERLGVKGCASPRGLAIAYFHNGRNVSSAVRSGSYRTRTLAPGATSQIRVVVRALARASLGRRTCRVTLSSFSRPAVKDNLQLTVEVLNSR